MTKEQQFDEELVAKIIAAAEAHGVQLGHMGWGVNCYEGEPIHTQPDGPCCAVGAGLLLRNGQIAASSYPWDEFASTYGVTKLFAQGVSDGYEVDYVGHQFHYGSMVVHDDLGYQRGVAVGNAVRAYFEDVP